VALRGVREDGQPLCLGRDYIKQGIRAHAEDLCTGQLGYRTSADIATAKLREVLQHRFTSLDRAIARRSTRGNESQPLEITCNPAQRQDQYLIARLRTLESMGLAESAGPDRWRVRQDFESVLRAV